MKKIFRVALILLFILIAIIATSWTIAAAYIAAVHKEFAAGKNAIFEKIEQFSKDLNKSTSTDVSFGEEKDPLDDINKIAKRDTYFYDRNGAVIAKYSHSRRQLATLRDIPYFLSRGFVMIEDQQFYSHRGINIPRFAVSVINNIITMGHSAGGSTISQQLAKILFTRQERSVKRKIYEIFCTIELERRFNKNELLTIYLNSIYLGHGVYGVQDAADFYFGKNVNELTIAEAALFIGMNRSPERYSPIKNKDNARKVQQLVLNQFAAAGMIDSQTITLETNRFWRNFENINTANNQSFWKTEINNSAYLTEYIRQILEREFRYDKITEGGLIVETTFDLEKQTLAENTVKSEIRHIRKKIFDRAQKLKLDDQYYTEESLRKDVETSLASIDFRTGEVLALVGGSGYSFANQFNRALYAKRSIGSSAKPFVYAYALNDKRIQPFSKFKDEIITYKVNGRNYTPKNYSGKASNDMITVYDALKTSLNTIPIKIMNELPIQDVAQMFRQAAFLLDEKNAKRVPEVLSLALGTCEMSALELATAYCIFPRLGSTVYPITIRKIYDVKGTVYYDCEREYNPYFNDLYPVKYRTPTQLIDKAVAYEIVQMMRSVFEKGGTGYGAAYKTGFNIPAYGKSGTTQDYKDGVFVGYNDREVTVTWVGMDSNHPILLASEGTAALIWCNYMKQSSKNYNTPISVPDNMILRRVCNNSGLLAGYDCTSVKSFYFWNEGPMPETCYIHTEEFFGNEDDIDGTYVPSEEVTEEDLYEYFDTEDEQNENDNSIKDDHSIGNHLQDADQQDTDGTYVPSKDITTDIPALNHNNGTYIPSQDMTNDIRGTI